MSSRSPECPLGMCTCAVNSEVMEGGVSVCGMVGVVKGGLALYADSHKLHNYMKAVVEFITF